MNLGLIPSSEEGWPAACAALKISTGGWLHIHGNVTTKLEANGDCGVAEVPAQLQTKYCHLLTAKCLRFVPVMRWIDYVVEQVSMLLEECRGAATVSKRWLVEVRHVEHVKSYAPHVSHVVLDLECRPIK